MVKKGSTGQLRKTAKHSAIYAVGTMISRLTALIMLPIYTRYLTPSDYGVIELLTMAIELSGILVGMRISQAMFRYYILSDSEEERQTIVSTVLFSVAFASSIGASFLYLSAGPLSQLIFGSANYIYEFQLFAFTLVTNALSAVGLSFIRARQKPVLFISVGVATLALQVTLNLIFVVFLELHVRGVVYSALISGVIVAISLCLYVLFNTGMQYSRVIATRLIAYISPLILASMGAFYVSYADKYFLRVYSGLADVGLYVLAARIGSVLSTVNQAFTMSWNADRFEIVKQDNAKEIFAQVFKYLSAILILIGTGLSLFAYDFFWIMTDPEFYSAGGIVPILMLALIMNIYTMFCNFGAVLNERTRYIAEGSWIKAIFATVGYLWLIPYFNVYGAAVTLLIANVIELIWVNRHARKLYDMGLDWSSVGLMIGSAIICVSIGLLFPSGEITYFLVRLFLFSGLIYSFYSMPIWKSREKQIIRDVIHKALKFRLKAI